MTQPRAHNPDQHLIWTDTFYSNLSIAKGRPLFLTAAAVISICGLLFIFMRAIQISAQNSQGKNHIKLKNREIFSNFDIWSDLLI